MELIPFLCLLFTSIILAYATQNDCDLNIDGTCFFMPDETRGWNEARAECQQRGGDLAVLEKVNVQRAVNKLARRDVEIWIGLRDLALDGQPCWIDSEIIYNINKAYPWAASDGNTDDKDCVLAAKSPKHVLEWRYESCDDEHNYLCEIMGSDDNYALNLINEEKNKIESARQVELERPVTKILEINTGLDLFEADIKLNDDERRRRDEGLSIMDEKRGATLNSNRYWPAATVHYVFDDNYYNPLSYASKQEVRAALADLESVTCLNFVEGYAYDHIRVVNENGCWSYIGRQGGTQYLSLQDSYSASCIFSGIIQHEFLHAIGFWHEQSRPDRASFVTINWANILPGAEHNFNTEAMTVQNTYYDFGSVMHYSLYAFAIDSNIKTIIPNQTPVITPGQIVSVSVTDVAEVIGLYNCYMVVHGGWSTWSSWSNCPVTCDGGLQTRTRQCNYPPPSVNPPGLPCIGDSLEYRDCMTILCPLEIDYQHRGCWSDMYFPSLLVTLELTGNPYLDGNYWSRSEPGRKCARAAVHANYQYFAMRFDGRCYATSSAWLYQSQGASTDCVEGFGTTNAIDVYEIEDWVCPDGSTYYGFCYLPLSFTPHVTSYCPSSHYCVTIGGTSYAPVSICCKQEMCIDNCDDYIYSRDCWCDTACVYYGDCCFEYADQCSGQDICWASGDPHYYTLDNLYYDYQGDCDYILTKSNNNDFSVTVNNEFHNSYPLSWTNDIKLNIYNHEIRLLPYKYATVDGSFVNPPVTVTQFLKIEFAGYWLIVRTGHGMIIYWNGYSTVYVYLSNTLQGDVSGLCGNFNGNPSDDWTKANGVLTSSVNDFGDSWAVSANCAPAPSKRSIEEHFQRNTAQAEEICNELFNSDNIPSCSVTLPGYEDVFKPACEMDVAAALPDDDTGGCDLVASYVDMCRGAGGEIGNWRSGTVCEISCEDGKVYKACGSACPPTCETPEPFGPCTEDCVEGCFCANGTIMDEGGICKAQEQCGCYWLGVLYRFGEEMPNNEICACDDIPDTVCIGCRHFEINTDEVNFAKAKTICQSRGGRLAKLDTQPVFKEVRQFMFANNYEDEVFTGFWFGLDDIDSEGEYVWCDGTSLDEQLFTKWGNGQPNNNVQKNPDGQDCAQLWAHHLLTWDDEYCGDKKGYICEYDYCLDEQ
ncbi:uncharacterized protein LOC100366837 [Saccoglossus kowalevskii]|uniref:Metalloendopeptidase n=1 Tax=Saccoglossus kowalevskii TaxID=10224 RepID=A0ABM0MTZ3_SACKO|nr:PREDICTED: uncharacterized protein LOC100366837 [Saccoglossus kowalevskii]